MALKSFSKPFHRTTHSYRKTNAMKSNAKCKPSSADAKGRWRHCRAESGTCKVRQGAAVKRTSSRRRVAHGIVRRVQARRISRRGPLHMYLLSQRCLPAFTLRLHLYHTQQDIKTHYADARIQMLLKFRQRQRIATGESSIQSRIRCRSSLPAKAAQSRSIMLAQRSLLRARGPICGNPDRLRLNSIESVNHQKARVVPVTVLPARESVRCFLAKIPPVSPTPSRTWTHSPDSPMR